MKSIKIPVFCFLFILIPSSSFSQPPGMKLDPGIRMKPWKGDTQCWKASGLNLTSDQTKALILIQQAYFKDTLLLRTELFSKHFELREFLTNPSAKMETIRTKHGEIAEMMSKLEERAIDYLIKVRGLLTQEQLKVWCPDQEFPVFRRMMYRPGPMGQYPPNQ
jgi:hypothetical protein